MDRFVVYSGQRTSHVISFLVVDIGGPHDPNLDQPGRRGQDMARLESEGGGDHHGSSGSQRGEEVPGAVRSFRGGAVAGAAPAANGGELGRGGRARLPAGGPRRGGGGAGGRGGRVPD